jgi:NitT/TauT family transport system ATP-binding protein
LVASPVRDSPAESPASPILTVSHIKMSYRVGAATVDAVDDVSFNINAREKVMVIGPSGCGKSTVLKAVAGFLQPEAGEIQFDGRRDLTPAPDRAVVFQEFDQLFPWRTVLDNVAYALRVTGTKGVEAKEQAQSYIDLMGLQAAAHRFPHQLSGGMKQRVAIARAIALQPKLLLMDEPFGSLDAITRTRLQQELNKIVARTHIAVMFVTHSIQEALVVGDRVVVFSAPPSHVRDVIDIRHLEGPEDPQYVVVQRHLEALLGATPPPSHQEGAVMSRVRSAGD